MKLIAIIFGLAALLLLAILPRLRRPAAPLGLGINTPERQSDKNEEKRAA